ncbi:MAG: tetratricopeptide repeat protein [Bacteroidia bacterium]|nr:tetratricopeptide repeat protein [Bacteroidia bacterium]
MKKLFFLTMMVAIFAASSVFAQKSTLRDAKRSLGSNDLNEARTLIKQAAENAETANDPETWKVFGDIGNKAFDNERTNQMLGKQANDQVMYDGLLESYLPYLKADSLGELPNEKGRVRNKFRKDIAGILKANHPFYINGGVFYNEKQEYSKASDFFETYWNIPTLPMFAGQKDAFLIDSTYQTIKYYAIITAIQAKDHKRALSMLERTANEPFIENSAYKESDVYELMASEYMNLGDSTKFVETLYKGAERFPQNGYFSGNIVNVLVRQGKNKEAIEYLDKAIASDPQNPDYYRVKGALFSENKDYKEAENQFKKSLEINPDFESALEGLAVLYILQAQDIKEKTATMSDRKLQLENDKKTVEFYQKSLPHLEKYTNLLKARSAVNTEIDSALMKLRNVYYNLSMMGVDKSAELKQVEAELGL